MHAKEQDLAKFAHIKDPLRQKFASMHAALDAQIGRVLDSLRKHQLEENTLIFFVSDNGGPTAINGSRNTPLRGFKAETWEGGIRVPFLAQWKGKLPAGKVYEQPVIQLDILPTALAAAGAEVKAEWKLDGVNLLPYLTGKQKSAPHAALYWRLGEQIAVRMGDWKLVKAPGANADRNRFLTAATTEGAHLYNLAGDIGEQRNLAEKEAGKRTQLAAAWDKWNAELIEPKWLPRRPAPNRRR
jgi:arylsulfatase A-like enzyme